MELAEKTYAEHAWERHAQSGAGKRPDRVFRWSFRHVCVYPLDLVKNKLSAHVEGDVGDRNVGAPPVTSSSVAAAIFKEKGVSGFYSGITGRALHCFVEDFVFFWCVFYSSLHDC